MSNLPTTFADTFMGIGPGGPLPIPSPWSVSSGYITYTTGGVVVGTPTGGNQGPGTLNAANLFVNGISVDVANFLPLTGGTIGGPLTVNGNFTVVGTTNGVTLDMGTF
jgi:hypothetical protein